MREIARSNDIVYEAIDPTLNRRVALKELAIPPNLAPNEREERRNRFRREAEAAGRLSHPNIVSVFDYGTDRDRCYIAMEFLEGQTLGDVIRLRGALAIEETTQIMLELLGALAYAHERNVVHRDIKPDNVQILPGGQIKLTDFGIARLMDEPSITGDGQVFGTPSYMSPEQVAGKQIDARSDVFSCGVLLYEMLTGRKPFSGDSVVTITYNIMNREPTPPPGVPPYLNAIIRKAMSKDPLMRYQTAEEMAEDLKSRTGPNGFADPFAYSAPPVGGPSTVATPPPGGYSSPTGPPPPTSAPDPFLKAPIPAAPPPPPREPILSPEARNFLSVLFIVIGLTGLLLVAIWLVSEAYQGFVSSRTEESAIGYYNQGIKLSEQGDYQGAIDQFRNVIRLSPKSKTGRAALENLVGCYVVMGSQALKRNETQIALSCSEQALAIKKDSAAAFALAGDAHARMGQVDKAVENWHAAAKADPASEEAKYSRERIGAYYYLEAERLWQSGRHEEAVNLWIKTIREVPGTQAAQRAQQRLDEMQGVSAPG